MSMVMMMMTLKPRFLVSGFWRASPEVCTVCPGTVLESWDFRPRPSGIFKVLGARGGQKQWTGGARALPPCCGGKGPGSKMLCELYHTHFCLLVRKRVWLGCFATLRLLRPGAIASPAPLDYATGLFSPKPNPFFSGLVFSLFFPIVCCCWFWFYF